MKDRLYSPTRSHSELNLAVKIISKSTARGAACTKSCLFIQLICLFLNYSRLKICDGNEQALYGVLLVEGERKAERAKWVKYRLCERIRRLRHKFFIYKTRLLIELQKQIKAKF